MVMSKEPTRYLVTKVALAPALPVLPLVADVPRIVAVALPALAAAVQLTVRADVPTEVYVGAPGAPGTATPGSIVAVTEAVEE
jgi:hypothetical protein